MSNQERENLQGWLTHMTIGNTLAVVGALLIALRGASPFGHRLFNFGG